jgi:hypothetical protein
MMDNEEEKEDFDGASTAASALPSKNYKCERCHESYAFASMLGYSRVSGSWIRQENSTLSRSKELVVNQGFANKASAEAAVLTCYVCMGRLHNCSYVNDKGKLSSKWLNLVKASRGQYSSSKMNAALAILKKKVDKEQPGAGVQLEVVYSSLQDSLLRKATDFVTELAPSAHLCYGCPECKCYPVRGNQWWRCSTHVGDAEMTFSSKGHWRCANCLSRWSWATGGSQRVLVLSTGTDTNASAFYTLLGDLSGQPHIEAQLQVLKASRILETLAGREISKSSLLETIALLNDRAGKRLGALKQCEFIKAKDPRETGACIYCEDERLSLKMPGTHMKILNLSREVMEPISLPFFEEVIGIISAFLNIEETEVSGPSQRRAKNAILINPRREEARHIFASKR